MLVVGMMFFTLGAELAKKIFMRRIFIGLCVLLLISPFAAMGIGKYFEAKKSWAYKDYLDLRGERFIPASLLGAWRREAVEALMRQPVAMRPRSRKERGEPLYPERRLTYLGNVANARARHYYAAHGVSEADPAYELAPPAGAVLMTCRYCLRYALGVCPVRQGRRAPWREPLALRLPDGRRFPLSFDCQRCLMKVHAPE